MHCSELSDMYTHPHCLAESLFLNPTQFKQTSKAFYVFSLAQRLAQFAKMHNSNESAAQKRFELSENHCKPIIAQIHMVPQQYNMIGSL